MATPTPTAPRKFRADEPAPMPTPKVRKLWLLELYKSALGKKYAMAITGIFLIGWVAAHTVGNLKVFFGPEAFDFYADWLREGLGYPILPHTWTLWIVRIMLIGAVAIHIHAAYALTIMNRRARPERYQSKRDYVVADFAARTMRWTGVIILLFLFYHLADFTWGFFNPGFVRGEAYRNLVASFSNPLVSLFYVVANLALAYHLFHGAWSLFQSMGWNKPRYNEWRRGFAIAVAVLIGGANISFPIAVLVGIVG